MSLTQIETQVKKLLSQKASTPETMIELHIQIQNDLCQHIMKCGKQKRSAFLLKKKSIYILFKKIYKCNIFSFFPAQDFWGLEGFLFHSPLRELIPLS